MKVSQEKTSQLSENKCPDCLFMKLELVPVQPSRGVAWRRSRLLSAPQEQLDLYLTINFNEQWETLSPPFGRVKFGLRGGELKLKIENGKIPYNSRELNDPLEISILIDRQQQECRENQTGIEASWQGEKPGVKACLGKKQTLETTNKFQLNARQISTKGSEENPTWVFTAMTGEPILKGTLSHIKLATIDVTDKPCTVEGIFKVSPQDICLTDTEGILSPDFHGYSKKKRVTIDKLIANWLLNNKFNPYLSQTKLRYD